MVKMARKCNLSLAQVSPRLSISVACITKRTVEQAQWYPRRAKLHTMWCIWALATGAPVIQRRRLQRPRVLFICGSRNQTTQLHQVARHMPDANASFTPYFVNGVYELAREWGLLDFTIAGGHWRQECLTYLRDNNLTIDVRGEGYLYDLVVTCQDLMMPRMVRGTRAVLVQEGMVDPENIGYHLVRHFKFLPRWLASTAATGLSDAYDRFCVASQGFLDLFAKRGVKREKMVVTGIPNFSECETYRTNDFPHRGYLLMCTSDSRETFKWHNRPAFLRRANRLAEGRQIIVKLHPNERFGRAIAEVRRELPDALVLTGGNAEAMVANCDILVTEWSSTALVGLALGKQVYSNFNVGDLQGLIPLQTPTAAAHIAAVCRGVLDNVQGDIEFVGAHSQVTPGERGFNEVFA